MKKAVLKVAMNNEETKQKAMKIVCDISGVKSIDVDMQAKKMTVTGDIDPITIGINLRKLCGTKLLFFGPYEPKKKKEEPKKAKKK